MFDGFTLERVDVGEAELRVRHGGSGPAVLLLHGHPRTHATWHRVAPLLARSHTVVCPDLRGYGQSSKPPTTPDHRPYSKRAMAGDCLALMAALGHERFAVAGHDRGAYVALRTALDHPAAVTALAVLDAVPIGEALARCDARFAASWWHWFFYGQTAKRAERVIGADPDAWYGAGPETMAEEAYAEQARETEWAGRTFIREYPLNDRLLAVTQVWETSGTAGYIVATKGAPEVVARLCRLDERRTQEMLKQVSVMAARGLRVLGIARCRHDCAE